MNTANALKVLNWGLALAFFALTVATVWRWTGRPLWVDEGMLLKNLVEAESLTNLLLPMPYYQQAQPVFVSIVHTLILSVSEEIQVIRVAVAILSILLSSLAFLVFRAERVPLSLQAFVLFSFIYTLGPFYSEIKHYPFEMAFSFFSIFVLYKNYRRELSTNFAIFLICLASFIGFSTLIAAAILSIGLVIQDIVRAGGKTVGKGMLLPTASVLLLLIGYFHMKLLTELQMADDVYESAGLWSDVTTLMFAGIGAHGGYGAIAVAVAIWLSITAKRDSFEFLLAAFTFGMLFAILVGKITTVYPVISIRHVVWLVPFSLVIVTLSVYHGLLSRGWIARVLSSLVVLLLAVQGGKVLMTHVNNSFSGYADNDLLYEFLASYPASDVGVYPGAVATLEYYLRIQPELKKHVYFGLSHWHSDADSDSDSHDPRPLKEIVKVGFRGIENTERLYVISHLQPINVGLNQGAKNSLEEIVIEVINESGCVFESLMTGRDVQILRLDCT